MVRVLHLYCAQLDCAKSFCSRAHAAPPRRTADRAPYNAPARCPDHPAPLPLPSPPLEDVSPSQSLHRRLQTFFSSLDKNIRGIRLYRGEGRIVEQLADELAATLDRVLEDGAVSVRIAPFGAAFEGQPVSDPNERAKYLFMLYLDGVRELTFLPGIDRDELGRLVRMLATESGDGEDSVTRLWNAELQHVQHYAVDRYAERDVADAQSGAALVEGKARRSLRNTAGPGGHEVTMSATDVRALHTEDVAAWVRKATAPVRAGPEDAAVAEAVRQGWASSHDMGRFLEIATAATIGERAEPSPMVLSLYRASISRGDADAVAAMLARVAAPGVDQSPALRATREALLDPDVMPDLAVLVRTNPQPLLPPLEALATHARDGLLALIDALPPGDTTARLQAALGDAGVDLTPMYVRRLRSEDEAEVIAAVHALGKARTPESRKGLVQALGSSLGTVRRAALEAMRGNYDDSARVALGHALRDPDKANRVLALDILASSGDTRVAWLLLSAAEHADFGDRSPDEQQAVIRALAGIQDARTLAFFDNLLSRRSAIGGAELIPLQLVAVEALADLGTPEAATALKKASTRWLLHNDVKAAARKAADRVGGGA